MKGFEWSLPTNIIFGCGAFKSAAQRLKGLGRRALIVTSSGFVSDSNRSSLLKKLTEDLQHQGVDIALFSEIEPNPRTTTIDRAAALARAHKTRYIIALGGGSVMDAAKCIAMLCANEGSVWDYTYKGPGQPMKKFNHALPLVCIPTVAATGSETNSYAVVTHIDPNSFERTKSTLFGQAIQPKLSIIDSELTFTVSPQQTIDGAFDILTHALETYLSSNEVTPLQDAFTEAIVEIVVRWLPVVLKNPTDVTGRSQLSWCAALALSGILSGREGPWPIHALEHGLSACTDVAHGRGLAFLLPRVMAFDAPTISDKLMRLNRKVFGTTNHDGLSSCHAGFFHFMKDVGAFLNFTDLGYAASDAKTIAQKSIDHALRVDGIYKRSKPEPYLDNVIPIYKEAGLQLLLSNL